MKYEVLHDWKVGDVVVTKGTVLDFDNPRSQFEGVVGRDRCPPLAARAMDQEAFEAQVRAYPDAKHLLGGAWA
jgi:hypothetical protein